MGNLGGVCLSTLEIRLWKDTYSAKFMVSDSHQRRFFRFFIFLKKNQFFGYLAAIFYKSQFAPNLKIALRTDSNYRCDKNVNNVTF